LRAPFLVAPSRLRAPVSSRSVAGAAVVILIFIALSRFSSFFEPLRSSSSRRRDFHLLRAIALIFIAPSRFSSFSSHCAHLHRAVAIFIFFEPSR
jgi:hypothetical protein